MCYNIKKLRGQTREKSEEASVSLKGRGSVALLRFDHRGSRDVQRTVFLQPAVRAADWPV